MAKVHGVRAATSRLARLAGRRFDGAHIAAAHAGRAGRVRGERRAPCGRSPAIQALIEDLPIVTGDPVSDAIGVARP